MREFILTTIRREPYTFGELWHETQVLRRNGVPDMPRVTAELVRELAEMEKEGLAERDGDLWKACRPKPIRQAQGMLF